jgi:hypothetical protein
VPIRFSAGTTTSSKNRENCFSGEVISTGMYCFSNPLELGSTRNSDSFPRPVASSVPVRATTTTMSASSTADA